MSKALRILILEDDLETLSILLKKLYLWEEEQSVKKQPVHVAVTIFSEGDTVEDYLSKASDLAFDVILLDRDDKAGGSLHVESLKKLDPSKIIAISSVPQFNEEVRQLGVTKVVLKEYMQLEKFAEEVTNLISQSIENGSLWLAFNTCNPTSLGFDLPVLAIHRGDHASKFFS